jgi:SAM-dependent methyltransferase
VSTTSYDVVEYAGGTFPQTHPSLLAAIARLHGVSAASPTRCRVLELGTSDGGNLLPMALAYPHAEFVGCDLAETAVAKGLAARDALGIKNLTLLAADLCELPESLGQFDYILAHGVFSWVPDPVRDGLLDLCRRFLTPTGVAYVSYNAMPGGHVPQMLAEIMRFHVRRIPDPAEQISQSRNLMRMIRDGTNVPGPLGEVYKAEAAKIADYSDAVLFHDDLAAENRRFYVHEFLDRADRFGLQFLGEADYHEMSSFIYPPGVAKILDGLSKTDRVLEEQYRDFLQMRRFRQTLLVKADVKVEVPARVPVVADLWVTSLPVTPSDPSPDLRPGVRVQFDTAKGSRVTADHPLSKSALLILSDHPRRPVAVAHVLAAAAARLGLPPAAVTEADAQPVFALLYQAFQVGMVHLAVDPPTFAVRPGETPTLSPLTRYELEADQAIVTTLRHGVVRIDTPLTRQLLLACDGKSDRSAILDRLVDWATTTTPPEGHSTPTREEARATIAGQLDAGLAQAADLALLVD